jgi:hypothetical protein
MKELKRIAINSQIVPGGINIPRMRYILCRITLLLLEMYSNQQFKYLYTQLGRSASFLMAGLVFL